MDSVYFENIAVELPMEEQVPIGRPFPNSKIYLLDRNLQPVPIGIPGEIHIGGVGVARGYLNDPELTQRHFIANPFVDAAGERLYKTGDMGYYLTDGNIKLTGRVDQQIKIRGVRIEPGEIEVALLQHKDIHEAVVIARNKSNGEKQLVAYVVGGQVDSDELRVFLGQKLPNVMTPAVFMRLDKLPVNPNGKIDRKMLPESPDSEVSKVYTAPRTDTEELLTTIWTEVLGVPQVGVHDNFFELGGDSILSIQVIARARQADLQLTPRQLFQHQSIAELAAVAKHALTVQAEQGLVTGAVLPTPIQQWFFEQQLPQPHHFNQAVLLQVAAELNPDWTSQIIGQLIMHHDVLRLRCKQLGARWELEQMENESALAIPFEVVDLADKTSQQQQVDLEAIAAIQQASLKLGQSPLIKVTLFKFGINKPGRLLIVIHHLVVDGVSWRILLEDWQTAYQQLSSGKDIVLPVKTVSFKIWAERLLHYAQTEALATQQDYWLGLTKIPPTLLPGDYSQDHEVMQQGNTVASAARVSMTLDTKQTRALLEQVPQAYHTQINDVLLTALTHCLADWLGQSKVLIDLEAHGREDLFDDIDLSRTVGWFTSVYPVCLEQATGEYQPGSALKSIKEQLRQIPQHGIGYGLLRYLKQDEALQQALREVPQAQVSFNYLGQFDQVFKPGLWLDWSQESTGPAYSLSGPRSHLLEIEGKVIKGCLQIDWVYSKNCHRKSTMEMLAQSFKQNLLELISHCLSPQAGGYTPSDFPLAGLDNNSLEKLTHLLSAGKAS